MVAATVPGKVEPSPRRLRLFWRWFIDAILVSLALGSIDFPTAFIAGFAAGVQPLQGSRAGQDRRDYWKFDRLAANDDGLREWAGRQTGFDSVRVERVEPDALIVSYRSEKRVALMPSWEGLGYASPVLSSSDVREASRRAPKKRSEHPPATSVRWWGTVAAGALACGVLRWRARRARERGEPVLSFLTVPGPGWLRPLIFAGLAAGALTLGWNWLKTAMGLGEAAAHPLDGILARLNLAARLPFFVSMVIVTPLVEEWLYRGMLFSRFSGNGYVPSGAIVSALAFALAHGIPVSIPYYTGVGLILAWLCYRTGSLWPPIALHIMSNGWNFLSELW